MQYTIIMLRSLTYAQRAARALERMGFFVSVTKAPQELAQTGCHYGVKVRAANLDDALAMLERSGFQPGRIIGLDDRGKASVVRE